MYKFVELDVHANTFTCRRGMTHLWILKMDVMTGLFFGDMLLHHLQCCHDTVNRHKTQLQQH